MKKLMGLAVVVVLFLSGCGGGGGDGGGPNFPTTPVGVNDQASGSLTSTSIQAPDGTYLNFYTVTLPSAVDLNVGLESADFDTVLLLFQDAALAEPDLNNWDTFLLAVNDDIGPGTNSAISIQLPAGTYVIAVNSFDLATGAYLLTTTTNSSALTLIRQFLQFRTFEDPANNHFRALINYKDNGNLLQPGDLLSARLFNPQGVEVVPTSLQFISASYTTAAWTPAQSAFESIGTDGDSGFTFNLDNQADLPAGSYSLEVQPAVGGPLISSLNYPGKVALPTVAAAGMSAQWNQDGSLTLSWAEPAGLFDQYRVVLSDQGGSAIFYGRTVPGVSQVTLQAALVAQISQFSQVASQATINWTMQTRNYVGSDNYARGISDPIAIIWP
jgi:hypothetical protein